MYKVSSFIQQFKGIMKTHDTYTLDDHCKGITNKFKTNYNNICSRPQHFKLKHGHKMLGSATNIGADELTGTGPFKLNPLCPPPYHIQSKRIKQPMTVFDVYLHYTLLLILVLTNSTNI